MSERFDLVVLGSGPAGQKAAIQAAKLGASVAVVERRDSIGGVCANTGTIPSKTLREAAIYLTGLSDGGMGTWHWGARQPRRWAAIVPVAGGACLHLVPALKRIPSWCFHGDIDRSTPVAGARQMIEALRAAGAAPRYTEITDHNHNVWDKAYNMPKLYDWLLEHQLP